MTLKGYYLELNKPSISGVQRSDETNKRLNQVVRAGRAHGKNINNLRSFMKNGKWNYKYIK